MKKSTVKNCNSCQSKKFPSNVTPLSSSESHLLLLDSGGYDSTEYDYFSCNTCGAIWQVITDSGAGGHGKYYTKL